jgi:fructose-1,6-bisphosphatase/inositol monophosphatase family enzyme
MGFEWADWRQRLELLCDRIRGAALDDPTPATAGRRERGRAERPLKVGAGDVSYALDERTERVLDEWLLEIGSTRALSVLTEDRGWRHAGPGQPTGFDHGGPRIAFDPVDGTRNLMADLRSAWTVVSCAGPGASQPRMKDVELGLVSEIPTRNAGRFRRLSASREGPCRIETRLLESGRLLAHDNLEATHDDRPDHGYFPFFRYMPDQRADIARVEASFFQNLAAHEGADLRSCYDDQYISSAGQLVLLCLGTYRMICDLRALAGPRGNEKVTSKPYDLAGAVLCARAAGCIVTAPDGAELDFPIDCETPVGFVGWTNAETAERLRSHLRAALEK